MKKILLSLAAAVCAAFSASADKVVYEIDYSNTNWDFYVMGYTPEVKNGVLTSENPGGWYQYFIADQIPTVVGKDYVATVKIKTSTDASMALNMGWGWGDGQILNSTINTTAEWQEVSQSFKNIEGDKSNLVLQPGTYEGVVEIAWVKVAEVEGETPVDPVEKTWVSIINGGVAADGSTASIQAGWSGDAPVVANPAGEGVVFECPIAADPENAWDSQMFIVFNETLEEGAKIKVSFDYYCSDARNIDTQAQGAPGEYHHWQCIGSLAAKPEWQSFKKEVVVGKEWVGDNGFKTIAFNLASAPEAATFYVNNVVIEKEVEVGSAVEAIAPVKVNSAVYNLQGVKVANSLDEVAAPGLYISNGKKVIKK